MKKFYSSAVLCCLVLTLCSTAFAGTSVVGIASLNYEGGVFSSDVDKEVKDKAVQSALLSAWKKYTTSFNAAKYKTYMTMEQDFTGHLDQYVASYNVIDEKNDSDEKKYTVAVKALINVVAVDSKLSLASAAGSTASGEGSMFSFIFVARDMAEVKSYDNKVTKISKAESMSLAKETGTMGGAKMVSGQSRKSLSKTTTGGSSVKKADKIRYVVSSAADVDAAMNEILSPAGFEVVEYADIVSECGGVEPEVIKKEFSSKAELSRKVRKAAIAGARECEVPIFAIGTLDAGIVDTDPTSGLKRVYVSVNAKVYNIKKRLPKKVASVGPVQFAGLGPSAIVAKRNALSKAAKAAARSIVDQLNAKGVK
ncbi:hypothetical protein [Maridesulfovibrio hydrothermalis]|uniref:LPP20 lipoprotein n=1 Tax=Maridesulfovibrio hydrothermalis AM13 = DSM 14728 TaxID=1121451 RepID=L0RAR5_9BACT|nr:hypothetical protein [Maridesulfovibrio hydrothermalis]CCO23280.1 conserved exported protein of unknown function [Maridesulfovibrio hydrothermalis AM13 = DSM 14728]